MCELGSRADHVPVVALMFENVAEGSSLVQRRVVDPKADVHVALAAVVLTRWGRRGRGSGQGRCAPALRQPSRREREASRTGALARARSYEATSFTPAGPRSASASVPRADAASPRVRRRGSWRMNTCAASTCAHPPRSCRSAYMRRATRARPSCGLRSSRRAICSPSRPAYGRRSSPVVVATHTYPSKGRSMCGGSFASTPSGSGGSSEAGPCGWR